MILIYPESTKLYEPLYLASVAMAYDNKTFKVTKYRWVDELHLKGNNDLPQLENYLMDLQYVHGAMLTVLIQDKEVPQYMIDISDVVLWRFARNSIVVIKNSFAVSHRHRLLDSNQTAETIKRLMFGERNTNV